ncbi:MAG: hypothetical protein AAGE52_38675 [Myxococcota bacterium]
MSKTDAIVSFLAKLKEAGVHSAEINGPGLASELGVERIQVTFQERAFHIGPIIESPPAEPDPEEVQRQQDDDYYGSS